MSLRYLPAGERGLVVEFGNAVSLEINARVRALALALEAAEVPGLIDVVPTYCSVGIEYDPLVLSFDEAERKVREVAATVDPKRLPRPKRVEIPTVYGGVYGPDLPFVAEHAGLSEAEVIRLHSQARYHVYMIGFTAGFAYLGGLPARLHTPRLPSPRIKVPKGSVAIGGSQTGAYPAETPGGWRIIGRTYVNLFDPLQAIPTPMQPGDTVQFVPIGEAEYLRATSHEPRAESREVSPGPRAPSRGGRTARLGAQALIEVLRPGLLTTVQDRGRFGFQKFGVPVSGGVDETALRMANVLVGNPQGAAALEMAALGPQLRFLADAVVALTGAEVEGDLDGGPVPRYRSFQVRAGQVLDVRACTRGLRAYLAIAGGIDAPVLLGSRSTCLAAKFGGLQGRALMVGDVLAGWSPSSPGVAGREVPDAWRPRHGGPVTLRVVMGPQDDAFTEAGRRTFLESTYRVSAYADRMGYRLDGPVIAHRGSADIISDWVPLGGVQVPGDGKPIILLADRQTTGGYPKIATVIKPDIGVVAQLRPGDALTFRAVSVAEAQGMNGEIEADLAALPSHLVSAEGWSYAAELGEVPGAIWLDREGADVATASRTAAPPGLAAVRSPMAAVVSKVLVEAGAEVAAGQALFRLQAMEMEFEVAAPGAGRVIEVSVREGDAVEANDVMARVDTSA
jgi:KipI family sensor histidine kinase inhibitor